MARKALLISGRESETVSTLARNLIHAGGLSLFARQMKQMKAIGIEEMHVVTDWFTSDFETEILKCNTRPQRIFLHNTKDAPVQLLDHNNSGDSWFLIEEGVILDDRIINHVAGHPAATVISFIGQNEFLSSYTALGMTLQLDGHNGYFGSIAKISGPSFAANIRKLNSLDGLQNAIKALSRASDCEIVPVTETPLYLASRERSVDLLWFPLRRREDGPGATDRLLKFFQNDLLDWPARYLYQPLENVIVKYLCKCPVRPLYVMIVTGLLALYVLALFWTGHTLTALAGAYSVSILYGVGDKLGRLKISPAKSGPKFRLNSWRLIRFLENLVEYGWYFAIAAYLSTLHGPIPLIMVAALILFRLADEIQMAAFYRITGRHIGTITGFDRKFHLIAGGRNVQMWILLPFAIFNLWYTGFGFICIYGTITFFIHQGRIMYHLKNPETANGIILAENFKENKTL